MKSYGFWLSLSSALVMLLTSLGKAFGFEVQNEVVEECVMSIAGFLAVFGIVSLKNKPNSDDDGMTDEDDDESSDDDKDNNEKEE